MKITEKVSPMHPDKIADRIAGALVDYCYSVETNPKCAFEVLIGHRCCFVTGETSVHIPADYVKNIATRICGETLEKFEYIEVPQDNILAMNQRRNEIRCGDNGVFAGYPMPPIHIRATRHCKELYDKYPYDGKLIINDNTGEETVCWSNTMSSEIQELIATATSINPLGPWTGGINVDTGITGRKLASDFYGIEFPLGGGTMHGKDLSKADCSVNIFCFLEAQKTGEEVKAICSIGDADVNVNGQMIPFATIVQIAKEYIQKLGGFEKLAEWGLR